jgi:tetratricopeptide (TPR) repeat protein
MKLVFEQNTFRRGYYAALPVLLILAASLFAQTGGDTDQPNSIPREELAEAKKSGCDISNNPYCEEIGNLTDQINNALKPGDKGYSRYTLLDLYADRGQLYFKSGNFKSALSDFNKGLSDQLRGSSKAYIGRGDIYLMQGKLDDALKDYVAGTGSGRGSARAYLGLGNISLRRREYEAAFRYFQAAIEHDRRLGKAYFGRGVVFIKRGDDYRAAGNEYLAVRAYKDALYDLNSAIEILLLRTDAETYRMQAKAFEAIGDTAEAEKSRKLAREWKQPEDLYYTDDNNY